jgi:hypothetical protein
MDFYHNWIYQYIVNTQWFLWAVVGFFLAMNFIGPILIWRIFEGNKRQENNKEG